LVLRRERHKPLLSNIMVRVILSLLSLVVASAVHAGPPGPEVDLQPPLLAGNRPVKAAG